MGAPLGMPHGLPLKPTGGHMTVFMTNGKEASVEVPGPKAADYGSPRGSRLHAGLAPDTAG